MKIRWLSIISLLLCFALFTEFFSMNTLIGYAGSVRVEQSSEDFKNGKINSEWYATSDVESASNADSEASIVFPEK